MEQSHSNTAEARRAVIESLIERLHREGPEWFAVVSDKNGVIDTLASIEAGLHAMAQDDGGEAFRAHLAHDDGVKSITLTAEALREHIALAEQDLRGTRETLKRLRERKAHLVEIAVDPVAKAAWFARVESSLMKSEQASLADIEKYNQWLPRAPVVLTRG